MEPLRLVDELRQAIERQDADEVARLLHPDVELRLQSAQGAIIGREEARAWYRRAFGSRVVFEGRAEPEPAGDGSLVMRGRVIWHDEGVLRDEPARWRITFRDGFIATITAEGRERRASDAAATGVPEQRAPRH